MTKNRSNNKQKLSVRPANIREAAAALALEMAGQDGWDSVKIPEIAVSLELGESELLDHIRDKADLLTAIAHRIDRRALRSAGGGEGACLRDRLFDLMMERFDAMNEDRNGLVSILQSFKYDPLQALLHAPDLGRSMHALLAAAGQAPSGASGALKIAALAGIFLKTMRVWAEDDSADLSKTMAALDRDLAHAEKAAEFLRF